MNSYNRSPLHFLFYPFVLILLALGIREIYKKNPSLMDHLSLIEKQKKELTRSPLHIIVDEELSLTPEIQSGFSEGIDTQRTNSMPSKLITSVRFNREGTDWGNSESGFSSSSWNLWSDSVLVVNKHELKKIGINGEAEWSFNIGEDDTFCLGRPSLANDRVFVSTQKGKTLALSRTTGDIIWYREQEDELKWHPTLFNNQLALFHTATEKVGIEILNAATGKTENRFDTLKGELSGLPAIDRAGKNIIVQFLSGQILQYQLDTGKEIWKHENPTGMRGSPALIGNRIIVASEDGFIYARDTRNGKEIWNYSVEQKISLGLTVIADIAMGFVIDDESSLHAIDLSEGKRKWRISLKASAGHRFTLGAKAQSEQIKKLVIPAGSLDWVLWASTGENTLTGFDPKHGIPLARLKLGAPLAGSPLWHPEGHTYWVARDKGDNGQIMLFGELPKPPEPSPTPSEEIPTEKTEKPVDTPANGTPQQPKPTPEPQ